MEGDNACSACIVGWSLVEVRMKLGVSGFWLWYLVPKRLRPHRAYYVPKESVS